MKIQTIALSCPNGTNHTQLIGYILQNHEEYCASRTRPAVVICPGGGYEYTSEREATPVALEFVARGIHAFVLHYTCDTAKFPTQLIEVATAVKTIRERAKEWNIIPNQISVCGFSAGGHLAGSLGVFWNHSILRDCGFSDTLHKPNALILSYPVITSGAKAHRGSFTHLLEEETKESLELVSLEHHVTKDVPPVFIWHTFDDTSVPVENTLLFANATVQHGVLTELHIYPSGRHGISTATSLVNEPEYMQKNVGTWLPFAIDFITSLS
ncbi:MAG: alpha/beta hydrolase [Eubacteriales bacterium]